MACTVAHLDLTGPSKLPSFDSSSSASRTRDVKVVWGNTEKVIICDDGSGGAGGWTYELLGSATPLSNHEPASDSNS